MHRRSNAAGLLPPADGCGDCHGERVDRETTRATDSAPFGTRRFEIPFDAAGKSWVRFAKWDSAGNGAFVQPVWLTAP